jgi:hypothetical protein
MGPQATATMARERAAERRVLERIMVCGLSSGSR